MEHRCASSARAAVEILKVGLPGVLSASGATFFRVRTIVPRPVAADPGARPGRRAENAEPATPIALLADIAFAMFGAPGVTVGIRISQMMSVLAALSIAVSDVDSNHFAVRIRKHHGVFSANGLTAGKKQYCRGGNDAQ
jgi:hypothetical protein